MAKKPTESKAAVPKTETFVLPKRVLVQEGYRSVSSTNMEYIEPGEYEVTDAKLHGLAGFLVETNRAVVTQTQTITLPVSEPEDEKPDDDDGTETDNNAGGTETKPDGETPKA